MPGTAMIVGMQLFSALGLSTPEVTAAVRGRSARFTETGVRDARFAGVVAAVVPEQALPPVPEALGNPPLPTARELRLLRLASTPLTKAVGQLQSAGLRPAIFLALPDTAAGRPIDDKRIMNALLEPLGARVASRGHAATFRGRAGGISALGSAIAAVESGAVPAAIAGGVDTLFDLAVLAGLASARRLKTASNSDGLIPGEAAAFIAIVRDDAASASGLPTLARVGPVALGEEPGHLGSPEPYRGEGLAAAIRALLTAAALPEPVRAVYCTMNGESHWGKEWGVAYLRNRDAFDADHGIHHPADSHGDIGAASAAMLLALAADGLARGYRTGPVMVYASSDTAARGVTLVTAAST